MKKSMRVASLVMALMFLSSCFSYAGALTANSWFYKPAYGEKGATAYSAFNAAVDASDTKWQAMYVAYLAYGNVATLDPGHKHSKLWASDGSPEAVTVDAAGSVGVGTSTPAAKLELKDGEFILSGVDVAHGMTGIAPTNVYGYLGIANATNGGLIARGLTDADTSAVYFSGVSGAAAPTTPVIYLQAAKKDGVVVQDLAAGEIALQLVNQSTELLTVLGNGNLGIGKTAPGSKLAVVGLPTYADNAAALTGGLTAGDFYRTATGVVMVTYTP